MTTPPGEEAGADIALVGMAGRFPGAHGVRALWRNLVAGRDSITRFTDAELRRNGVSEELLADPAYVKAGSVLTGIDRFDAAFFGLPPSEAAVLDPQQRLFLENAWYALEDAAVDPARYDGAIGVVAGSALSTYLMNNLVTRPELADTVGAVQVILANDKDSLATRVAYALDLTGPTFGVQSYCSTSLVAVCVACSALVSGEADVMLAGGVSVSVPHNVGYLYQEAGMSSPDGRCRAFDAAAQGTPVGSGVGVVVLKRLADALADGDRVYAVIKGWAVGNDGADKVGFPAPGVRGEAGVIAEALAAAGLRPGDIDYVEAHGTGTALGDAVEIAALQRVYDVPEVSRVGIGSVKTNLGHLDRAAGVTGLIKTALALHHERLPATLHHERDNPQLARSGGRLAVVDRQRDWPRGERPRRAGVSAFGMGGTNAHVVLEEAPVRVPAPLPPRAHQILIWSARTPAAAAAYARKIRSAVTGDGPAVPDIAFTLQTGRARFAYRRAAVTGADPAADLADERILGREETRTDRAVGFLLAGVGEHYRGMVASLYAEEPGFAAALDECVDVLTPLVGRNPLTAFLADRERGDLDLARLLGRTGAAPAEPAEENSTEIAQPAVFAIDYALGRLLMEWGLRPRILVGYSVGEVAAACLSGSLTLTEAANLVATRARLVARLPTGVMTAVGLSVAELTDTLGPLDAAGVDVAAINGPRFTVLAGPRDAVGAVTARLADRGIASRELATTHAFHSGMLRPAAAELTAWARANLRPRRPEIPYLSNLTGKPVTERQLADPGYWADQMCGTVRFADMLDEVLTGEDLLIEIGAGQSLGVMARNHPSCPREQWPLLLSTLPAKSDPADATAALANTVAQAWLAGAPVDWDAYQHGRDVHLDSAPDYPFERQSFWIEPAGRRAPEPAAEVRPERGELFAPRWHPAPRTPGSGSGSGAGSGGDRPEGTVWLIARPGRLTDEVQALLPSARTLPPDADFAGALAAGAPATVVYAAEPGFEEVRAPLTALGEAEAVTDVLVVTRDARAVRPGDRTVPERAAVFGPALVAPQEYDTLRVRMLDLAATADAAEVIVAEITADPADHVVAVRDGERFALTYGPVEAEPEPLTVGPGDVCLITGGLGPVGLLLAGRLGERGATVVLAGRSGLPPADTPDPALRARLDGVAALTGRGITVETISVDVTDTAALTAAIAGVHDRHGRLDGVFHLAAVTDPRTFSGLADTGPGQREAHFGAKTDGARALDAALLAHPARFCVLFSSMSAVLGGLTFASYAGANSVLDAWAHAHTGPTRWLTINWDTWAPTAVKLTDQGLGASLVTYSLTATQALDALDAVLARPVPRTLVCAGDLDSRLSQWVNRPRDTGAAPEAVRFARPELAQPYVPPMGARERDLAELWGQLLGVDRVGVRDNFADLGGTSLLALQMVKRIRAVFDVAVSPVTLFEAPTVRDMARVLGEAAGDSAEAEVVPAVAVAGAGAGPADDPIAVIGLAGRFPGAADVDAFWENLRGGVESVTRFTRDELLAAGVPAERVDDPAYVPARPVLDDIRTFDAEFFGYSPRDAIITDPQHRLFLECCWEALENGGYGARRGRGRVGVFGGSNMSSYLLMNAAGASAAGGAAGEADIYSSLIGNDKDALTTSVSYKLGLTGPSLSVQTFCSTALVALHLAAQSLRAGECDLALAGGVAIHVPDRVGHQYIPGGMESPDGRVRAFDDGAGGTLFGDGAGVVLLKRLSAARADGDTVLAVVRGSAVNNDGSLKVGYTAPSVVGQATVIAQAMAGARVSADDISYVEAHGTGTPLGDPIEITALTRAFATTRRQYVPIGSVKTNIGHLGAAAGATGLIKTVLALRHREIPPSLNFSRPNQEIDFAASPFFVNTRLRSWDMPPGRSRIAGLNSLGMGGTNVHVVLEQAPEDPGGPAPRPRRFEPLLLSGRSERAAGQLVDRLRERFGDGQSATATTTAAGRPGDVARLGDVAFTLQTGRETFEHRRALVVDSLAAVAQAPVLQAHDSTTDRPVAFLFAGVGEQYPGMIHDLYEREPAFRTTIDECAALLRAELDADPIALLTAARTHSGADGLLAMLGRADPEADPEADPAAEELARTELAQPALFAVQYALARLLIGWGVEPVTMLGYSLGEYVAACLAGVLTLDEAVRLVAYRAKLISELPAGAMLAVALTPEAVSERLGDHDLDIAVVTGPEQTVLGGEPAAVDAVARRLARDGVPVRTLATTHAFHTRMMAPIADRLTAWVSANIRAKAPTRTYLSDVTGGPATADLVTDPGYWSRHMCSTVRFGDVIGAVLADPDPVLLELGPGRSLGVMVRTHPDCPPQRWPRVVAAVPAAADHRPGDAALAEALAQLWLSGVTVDWAAYHEGRAPRRVPLPTYPFQRREYWMGAATPVPTAADPGGPPVRSLPKLPEENWLHVPVWRRSGATGRGTPVARWLVLTDTGPADAVAGPLIRTLLDAGGGVTVVRPGTGLRRTGPAEYTVRPGDAAQLRELLRGLRAADELPDRAIHLWTLSVPRGADLDTVLEVGHDSLVALATAANDINLLEWSLDVVTTGTQPVTGTETIRPELATVTGAVRVVPLEYAGATCRLIDIDPPDDRNAVRTAATVAAELGAGLGAGLGGGIGGGREPVVALRAGRRWLPDYESLPPVEGIPVSPLREGGVYLITGGLGGIGLAMAEALAREVRAKIVLFGRSGLPPHDLWESALADPAVGDEARRRLRGVRRVEELGGEVEIVTGDVAEEAAVRRAVRAAVDRWGGLHGVIHAAAVPAIGLMQFKSTEDMRKVTAPKIDGTLALEAALRDLPLDFLCLFSSITSATGGGPGQVDYCAANAFLDAYATAVDQGPGLRRTVAIGWGEWQWNAWEAGLVGYDDRVQEFFRDNRARFGIDFAAGFRAMLRSLSQAEPHVVVSTQDFSPFVKMSVDFTVDAVIGLRTAEKARRHPRPALFTDFVRPSGPTEEAIAEVWSEMLHIDGIGADDNFFELGGSSLIGMEVMARIRRSLGIDDLAPHVLYGAPTVAALARHVEGQAADDEPVEATGDDDQRRRSELRRRTLRRGHDRSRSEVRPS